MKQLKLNQHQKLITKWDTWRSSNIKEHEDCWECNLAKQWFFTKFRNSVHTSNSIDWGWLRKELSWGPVKWPVYWCELPELDSFDCGLFSAVTREYLNHANIPNYPVQFIQKYSRRDIDNWLHKWANNKCFSNWISEDLVYHELLGLSKKNNECISLWDPTDNLWYCDSLNNIPRNVIKFRLISHQDQVLRLDNGCDVKTNKWIYLK